MSNKFDEIYNNSIKNPENFWENISNDISFGLKNQQKF